MQEILSDREKIGEAIYEQVKEATDAWGVQVHTGNRGIFDLHRHTSTKYIIDRNVRK